MPNGVTGGFVAISDITTSATSTDWVRSAVTFNGQVGARVVEEDDGKGKISARLYFTYIKKNFNILQQFRIERRMKLLEKAFHQAVDNGQDLLAEKALTQITRFMRESLFVAKGIKYSISKESVGRYKRRIKGGHISDTLLRDYTRIIPKDVLAKHAEVKSLFDDFVIYHYWNKDVEPEKKMEMDATERANMEDPILFGKIKEAPDTLYFVADWVDEQCDLSFDEMLEAMGRTYDEALIDNKPNLS